VTAPAGDDFYFWMRVDPDLLSDKDKERFDMVNEWLTLFVPEKQQDDFFNAISDIVERKITRRLSDKVLDVITTTGEWSIIIHQLVELAK
jgi:hypothetical protein